MGLVCGLIVLLIVIVTARLRWVERSSVLRSVGQWLATAWTKWGAEMSPAMSHTGLPAVVSPDVATKSQSGKKERTAKPLKPRSADDCGLCRAEDSLLFVKPLVHICSDQSRYECRRWPRPT